MNRAQRRKAAKMKKSMQATSHKEIQPSSSDLLASILQAITEENWIKAERLLHSYNQLYPNSPRGYSLLGKVYKRQRRFGKAADCYRQAYKINPDMQRYLYETASCLRKNKKLAEAISLYHEILKQYPDHYQSNIGLSIALRLSGKTEDSAHFSRRAVEISPVFIRTKAKPNEPTVLVLKGLGNLNFRERKAGFAIEGGHNTADGLIPERMGRATVYVDNFAPDAPWLATIPKSDVALNVISDADLIDPIILNQASRLIDWLNLPVINHPKALSRSTRDGVFAAVDGIDHIIMPKTIRFFVPEKESIAQVVLDQGLSFPLIIRPVGTQTGEGMHLYKDQDELKSRRQNDAGKEYYAAEFFNFISEDGLYRKTRLFCIGGEIYPEHHVAADNWNIHAKNARKLMSQSLFINAEIDFIKNYKEYLGEKRIAAIHTMIDKIGLDYFGIDCSLLQDGRLLIFEANASMQFKSASQNERSFLLQNRLRISEAFAECINEKINSSNALI